MCKVVADLAHFGVLHEIPGWGHVLMIRHQPKGVAAKLRDILASDTAARISLRSCMRIVVAGFQHETNTFVAEHTPLTAFEQADSWPELLSGADVISATLGMNLPIAGFIDAAGPEHTILPILWASAEPGGKVTDAAYEAIAGRILRGLETLAPFEAVYLDLHGAMVTETHADGEGALLTRIRNTIGPDIPIVASLDLHANVSPVMVEMADALTIFRTYPHIDMAETGARAYRMLRHIAAAGRPAKAFFQADYLVPLHAQHTGADPARRLYELIKAQGASGLPSAELALGFTAADIHDVGVSIVTYDRSPLKAQNLADTLGKALAAAEQDFDTHLLEPEDAVALAMAAPKGKPVIIADVQDNPGAGASSDTTGLLRALYALDAEDTIFGLFHDPALAAKAHEAGVGGVFEARIGGRTSGDSPLKATVRVYRISDGACRYTGDMYGGGIAALGPSAALEIMGKGIWIVVTSVRNQCLDLAHFRHFDLEPASMRIVCVKSTAHFRADFEPISQSVLVTAAPGQFPCRLAEIEYVNARVSLKTTT
ncbi:MAG: M81 family metallopeptidase [Roseobacter sp.]